MLLDARKRWVAVVGVLAIALGLAATAGPARGASATYEDTAEDIRNPERGFFAQQDDLPGQLVDVRPRGLTLVRAYFRLDEHRDDPTLPAAYLDAVDATFGEARAQGVKLIVRFAYNHGLEPDAPLGTVLGHIDQLGPVLRDNSDVIQTIEAGFIGAWGEWHSSSNGLDAPGPKGRVLRRELDAFPREVKLAIRYPRDKRALLGTTPIARDEAHSDRPRARVGHHNDCVFAGRTEGGTWQDWKGDTGATERRFVDADAASVPMGGETCAVDPAEPGLAGCANARRVLERRSFTALNADFFEGVLDRWRADGCHGEIARRLGHRFALVDARMPDVLAQGGGIGLTFRVRNDGFAAPYNPRPVEVVLRHRATGTTTVVPTDADPRFWRAGEVTTVTVSAEIPMGLPAGEHDVSLALPDPSNRLRDRTEYAIRFANRGVWDQDRGRNDLGLTTRVTASPPFPGVDDVLVGVERLLERLLGPSET